MSGSIWVSRIIALAKKHTTWVVVAIVGIAGGIEKQYISDGVTYLVDYGFKTASRIACEFRQKEISDDSKFKILVSSLAHDPDGSHTERVKSAFHGEKGFLVVPICESVNFDYSKDLQTADDETIQRARDLIKARHADLLLFGEVRERDKAVKIYAVNEHGGCDLRPKPTIIEHGDLPDDFNVEEKENLIAVSLQEIQSACRNQSSINWEMFAKRMIKMENILDDFPLYKEKYSSIAFHYIDAMRFLYLNDQGDDWFVKGENFSKNIISKYDENNKAIYYIVDSYALLLLERFKKTQLREDEDAAFRGFNKAISLNPENSGAYNDRGSAYVQKGDTDRAIEDYDKAISFDPNNTVAYYNRGVSYYKKGDLDRAITDYNKAIGLDPKDAMAYNERGSAYHKKGDLDRAIADFDKAIDLDPKYADAFHNRGTAYDKKGDLDRAIADYDKGQLYG